jgi:uncharacterized alkaline shock family protein YloU
VLHDQLKQIDTKELELPETVFIRDIETRLFQSIALQCLARIEGVALIEGNLIDSLLGRDSIDRLKGIYVEQDQKKHSVSVKVEVNVAYGISIPEKAEEIQMRIAQDISRLTGLHVGCVHVVFKNLISSKDSLDEIFNKPSFLENPSLGSSTEKYSDEF